MSHYYYLPMRTKTYLFLADSLVINIFLEKTTVTFGCHLNGSALFPYSLPTNIPLS